jgi:hypothetical protein
MPLIKEVFAPFCQRPLLTEDFLSWSNGTLDSSVPIDRADILFPQFSHLLR